MAPRKSTRPPHVDGPPSSTMDVDPEWLVEFGEEEAPTIKRRPSRRSKAPSVPAPRPKAARPPPLPDVRAPAPVIVERPSTTIDVDPEWLEAIENGTPAQGDEAPTQHRKRVSERPPGKAPRPRKR